MYIMTLKSSKISRKNNLSMPYITMVCYSDVYNIARSRKITFTYCDLRSMREKTPRCDSPIAIQASDKLPNLTSNFSSRRMLLA